MKWYKDGIRFECQQTGQCCVSHGEYGYVFLTRDDGERLAKRFGITLKEFFRRFCDVSPGNPIHLKNPNTQCSFLEGKKCGVYEDRPVQCRTWPFWRSNLETKKWDSDIRTFCPGIGKGKLYTEEEIDAIVAKVDR